MRGSPSRRRESAPELRKSGIRLGSLFGHGRNKGGKRKFHRNEEQPTNDAVAAATPLAPERVEDTDDATDRRTSVLAGYDAIEPDPHSVMQWTEHEPPHDGVLQQAPVQASCGATAAFLFCSAGLDLNDDDDDHDANDVHRRQRLRMPEDPTVEESIECVFASQLEEGLALDLLWEEADEASRDAKDLMSPAMLLQSRSQSRLDVTPITASQYRKPKKTFRTGSLVHLGTYDAVTGKMSELPPKVKKPIDLPLPQSLPPTTPVVCPCSTGRKTPSLHPSEWPQYPLMLRAGPGTVVRGVRFSAQQGYLWKAGDAHTWVDALHRHWGKSGKTDGADFGCNHCGSLPINNGNEPPGEALVVDFESDLWIGTLLLRLRFTEGTTLNKYNDSKGYFAGMNRRYQAIITGSPKRAIPISNCVTGLKLEREAGKLPAKWILKGALQLLKFFAPQLECKLDHDKPYSLTPLGSTPQMLGVDCLESPRCIENKQEEPANAKHTLLGESSTAPSSLARAKFRKKALDKLYLHEAKYPQLTPQHEYTMEFLQHLFSFTTFEMELGSLIGNFQLKDLLNGQPLQLMAMEKTTKTSLWMFEIWHECLVEDSLRHD